MKGMLENHPLFLSVFVCVGGVIVASWEMAPQLNDMIQLAPFPDDTYRLHTFYPVYPILSYPTALLCSALALALL